MKNGLRKLIFGRDQGSFLIALAVVCLIALGCTCGKNFDLSNIGKESNTTRTSSSPTSDEPASRRTEGTKPDASDGLVPPEDSQLQYLVRETMLDFNDALQKEDFTDFHSNICKPWQKQVTPEGMKQMFQSFIDGNVSFSNVQDVDAEFTTRKVSKNGQYKILEVNGEYPTSPKTTFELNYLAEGSDWKLSKIRVETMVDRPR